MVVTVRDPYDSLVSAIRSRNDRITDETVVRYARELRVNGFGHLRWLKLFPRALVLRYEDFAFNYAHLFHQLAEYLGCTYTEADVADFAARFDVRKLREETAGKPFESWDPETGIHGSHISEALGRPGEGSLLTGRQRAIAARIMSLRDAAA